MTWWIFLACVFADYLLLSMTWKSRLTLSFSLFLLTCLPLFGVNLGGKWPSVQLIDVTEWLKNSVDQEKGEQMTSTPRVRTERRCPLLRLYWILDIVSWNSNLYLDCISVVLGLYWGRVERIMWVKTARDKSTFKSMGENIKAVHLSGLLTLDLIIRWHLHVCFVWPWNYNGGFGCEMRFQWLPIPR
jgi:hypothetical protein